MRLYSSALNSSVRALAELRAVMSEMAREDVRFDKAVQALQAEGRRVREANGDE